MPNYTDAPKPAQPQPQPHPQPQPQPQAQAQPVTVVMQADDRSVRAAEAMADGKALEMDVTVPGGKYKVGDMFVNANGEPLKGGN